jgi:hypothetical protein
MASPYCERVDDYFCASTARTSLIAGEFLALSRTLTLVMPRAIDLAKMVLGLLGGSH